MKILLLIVLVFFFIPVKSQTLNQADTSLVFSITIFNKADIKNQTRFPDVFPNIDDIKLISDNDTIPCSYDFPFLTLNKQSFLNLLGKQNLVMTFYYNYITHKSNSRFNIEISLNFALTFRGAKFILIEQDRKNRFYETQKWGSTLYIGGQLKSKRIY